MTPVLLCRNGHEKTPDNIYTYRGSATCLICRRASRYRHKYGPDRFPVARPTMEQRFWSKVDKRGPDECWPWTGYINHKGYGRFSVSPTKEKPAQRIAWELTNGSEMPEGLLACHSCDNRQCVNPARVWPGTHLENRQDMVRKGRGRLPMTADNQAMRRTLERVRSAVAKRSVATMDATWSAAWNAAMDYVAKALAEPSTQRARRTWRA